MPLQLFHINSRKFIEFAVSVINTICKGQSNNYDEEQKLMLEMLYYSFYLEAPEKQEFSSFEEALSILCKDNREMIEEAVEILDYNYRHIDFVDKNVNLGVICPLDLHCNYSTDQVMAALGYFNENKKPSFREGVKYFKEMNLDAFFITLNKSGKDYSPSTLYEDYAINERLFHWQSQSRITVESETGQRYINHLRTGHRIALFVRKIRNRRDWLHLILILERQSMLVIAGVCQISFVWRSGEEIPAGMMSVANKSIV